MSFSIRVNTPPSAIDAAIEAIATQGTYSAGARLLDISPAAFHQWRDADESLAQRCKDAIARRYRTHDVVKRALAEDIATRMLREGIKETTTTEKEVVVQLTGEVVTVTEVKEVHKDAPIRLIERYLQSDLEEFAMIKMLVMGGYLPDSALTDIDNAIAQFKQTVTGTIRPQGEEGQAPEISQERLIDAATKAVQRVFSKDAAPLSVEVVARSEPGENSREE